MRGVFILVALTFVAVFCRAQSEKDPYSGSGLVITPTTTLTKGSPPTDSTDDVGSGVDDEDDEDTGSGGVLTSTTQAVTTGKTTEPTTREPTTREPTTRETTTEEATTTKYISTAATTQPDDDEDSGDSGSGSGVGTIVVKTPESHESTTDIYLQTTTDDIILSDPTTTEESTSPTEASIVSIVRRKTTTAKTVSTEKVTSKPASKAPTTAERTTNEATTMAKTKRVKSRVQTTVAQNTPSKEVENIITLGVKKTVMPSTVQPETTREQGRETTEPFPSPKILFTNKKRFTTKEPNRVESTTAKQPGVMARKDDSKEGFTLTTEVIAGVVGCALLALILIAFLMYRLKKRDEGSYLLDESNAYPEDYKKAHVSDKEAFI